MSWLSNFCLSNVFTNVDVKQGQGQRGHAGAAQQYPKWRQIFSGKLVAELSKNYQSP